MALANFLFEDINCSPNLMGSCCPSNQTSNPSIQQTLSSSLASNLDDPKFESDAYFHSRNDKHFFCYPNYSELKKKLFEIQDGPSRGWAIHERDLATYKERVELYAKFLQASQHNILEILTNKHFKPSSLTKDTFILNTFRIDFQHCFLLEVRDLYFEIDGLSQYNFMLGFQLKNPLLGLSEQFQTETRSTQKQKLTFDYLKTVPLNTMDQELFDQTGKIAPLNQLFKDFTLAIQLYKQFGKEECTKLGNTVTFNLLEMQSQAVFNKILKINSEQGVSVARVTLRFQLIFNLRSYLEWWIDELEKRRDNISRVLNEIQKNKDIKRTVSGDAMESRDGVNFQSLMSSNGQLQRTESQYYDLPYVVK